MTAEYEVVNRSPKLNKDCLDDLVPPEFSTNNLARVIESGSTIPKPKNFIEIMKLTVHFPENKKQYEKIVSGVEDVELKKALESDTTMTLNLSAAVTALGKDINEVYKEGVLFPAVLVYKAVANTWDDHYDHQPIDEREDPVLVFNNKGEGLVSNAREQFERAIVLLNDEAKLEREQRECLIDDLKRSTEQYIYHEAVLADCSGFEDASPLERTVLAVQRKSLSFGFMAHTLTRTLNGNECNSEETLKAAEKMRYFALVGGIIDDLRDGKEDSNVVNIGNSACLVDKMGGQRAGTTAWKLINYFTGRMTSN